MCFFVMIPCYTSPSVRHVIIREGVDESLPTICKYQQNVPQHYYLYDTLVYIVVLSPLSDQQIIFPSIDGLF